MDMGALFNLGTKMAVAVILLVINKLKAIKMNIWSMSCKHLYVS